MKKPLKEKIIFIITFIVILILSFLGVYDCPYKKFYHIYCAGCGTTRMIKSIIKLEFYQAFRYNPLMFVLLILIIIYAIYALISKLLKKEIYKPNNKFWIILMIIVILFMILRNIPLFSFLAPTVVK